jgi:hypothetical protein
MAHAPRARKQAWEELFAPSSFNEDAVRSLLLDTGYPRRGCTSFAARSSRACGSPRAPC